MENFQRKYKPNEEEKSKKLIKVKCPAYYSRPEIKKTKDYSLGEIEALKDITAIKISMEGWQNNKEVLKSGEILTSSVTGTSRKSEIVKDNLDPGRLKKRE